MGTLAGSCAVRNETLLHHVDEVLKLTHDVTAGSDRVSKRISNESARQRASLEVFEARLRALELRVMSLEASPQPAPKGDGSDLLRPLDRAPALSQVQSFTSHDSTNRLDQLLGRISTA